MPDVLVTGAAGFIGGHTLGLLRAAATATVVAATRDGSNGSRRLDLRDAATIRPALQGIDAIVHCAVGDRAVTVDGTAALLRAAAQAGVRRVVHVSSIAVYGGATGQVREDTPMVAADGRGYAAWKAAAEQACLAETGVQTVRLRPTIVYGPGSTLWAAQMTRRIRSGRWGVAGAAADGTCNPVHVSDVATAIGAPKLPTLSPATVRTRAYAALGLKAVARIWPQAGRNWLLGAPARSELALFSLRASYPTDAARRVLGWAPAMTIASGLTDTVAWLRSEGLAA
jgi:nucleoside-diphosphate-sugar epimerase